MSPTDLTAMALVIVPTYNEAQAELKEHLYSLPETPDWIPYRTSYYSEKWGFCLTDRQLQSMPDGEYEVFIDTSLVAGHLTYGEYVLPGETDDEVLISCHSCHPSLANDNLSGMALAAFLARHLESQNRRYTYRFLFIPGTIGSITWLALNENHHPSHQARTCGHLCRRSWQVDL